MRNRILKLKHQHPELGQRKIAKIIGCDVSTVRYHLVPGRRALINAKSAKRQRSIKERLVKLHGEKCIHCGYSKCIAALQFHHRDSATKDLDIAHYAKSYATMAEEAAKCDLVCANCHAEIHYKIKLAVGTGVPPADVVSTGCLANSLT